MTRSWPATAPTLLYLTHRLTAGTIPIAVGLLLTVLIVGAPAGATEIPESSYSALSWRLAGPFRAGWATAVAGIPGDASTFYFGGADGGVWRTTDAGSTWQPLFDHQGSASIGALEVAASDPQTIWVGTGQIHQRWDIVDGDGVYRSTDGGESWTHLGLDETRHIGDLWVDPRDADTAVVAALGHDFGPHEERGLFRTTDGGATWAHVLYLNDTTGAADLAGDPQLPEILYASLWEVQRFPWLDYFEPTVGPGSGIYRSTDAGRTWTAVAGDGLPPAPLSRIELAVAPGTGAQRVWAAIETADSAALYRSEDGGDSWAMINDDPESLASSYMSGVFADPEDPDTVWAMGRPLRRSTDGGASFTIVRSSPGGDDYHALWIDPTDPRRMITGADQGAVITLNGGKSWSSWYNQPTGQFYRLAVDNEFPYRIYSGQQDSGTVGIASRSDYGQITFRDWSPVGGDERDGDIPDPTDPDIVYGAGLGGRVSRWNRRTGQVQNVSPWPVSSYAARPGTSRYRYDWITPLAISPRPPHALYLGAQVLFRSLDQGQSWETISPDLTGVDPISRDLSTPTVSGANVSAAVAQTSGCDGDVAVDQATACGFGVIFAIAPSPAADDQIWVGTTNGRVRLTRDGGDHWTDATPPGLADWTKVNIIDASRNDPATAYVAADRHRADDPGPIAFRTHDFGVSWAEIGHRLPADAWVGVVRQDPEQPGLLYAGTSRGVHVSFDDGEHWQPLQLNLPTTGINDLLVHEDDLIVATQGRAIWILDDVTPLRHLAAAAKASGTTETAGTEAMNGPTLVPPAVAIRLRANQNKDTPLPPEEPTGDNPPVGAVLDYILPAGSTGPVILEVLDANGSTLRSFHSDQAPTPPEASIYFADLWLGEPARPGAAPGHHRFVWDLRLPAPPTVRSSYSIAALPGRPTPIKPEGAFVLPGEYEVRLTVDGVIRSRPLTVVIDPRVTTPPADLVELLDFQAEVTELLRRSVDLVRQLEDSEGWIDTPRQGDDSEPGATATATAENLDTVRGQGTETPTAIAGELTSLASDLESVDAAPTSGQRELLRDASERLTQAESRWEAWRTR